MVSNLQRVPHHYRYIDDLAVALSNYVGHVVVNVMEGFLVWHGVRNPGQFKSKSIRKAIGSNEQLLSLSKQVRSAIGRRRLNPNAVFRPTGKPLLRKDGNPFTVQEWRKFERDLIAYVRPYLQTASEEAAAKSILLALMTHDAEHRNKANETKRKTLAQVERDSFGGYIPDSMRDAQERYRISDDVLNAYAQAELMAATHVQRVEDDLRNAIRDQVVYAQKEKLTPAKLASNLFWDVQLDPALKRSNADAIQRDWQRVAHTETAMYHEMGRAAVRESESAEQPVYVILHGPGTCPWCRAHLGDIARQIPSSLIGDANDDSLSSRNIKDPYTNVAYWPGKNNVGFSQAQWRLTAPVHPWCQDSMVRFYPELQEYDKDARVIKLKSEATELPEWKPALRAIATVEAERRRQEAIAEADRMRGEHARPTEYAESGSRRIGRDSMGRAVVDLRGQRYVAVDTDREADELEAQHEIDPSIPLPVIKNTTSYRRLFEGAN